MKTVTIVGIGMGPDTVTREGASAIENADALVGADRMLRFFSYLGKPAFPEYETEKIAHIVGEGNFERYAVLVSGDVGFYSAAEKLCSALSDCALTLLPGISSVSCFFARLQRPWQETALVSCHGREGNLADTVRRNRLTFALTGGNIRQITTGLISAGFGTLTAHVGENFGTERERIFSATVLEIAVLDIASLAVLLIENPDFDAGIHCGIPDDAFIRRDAPMTKSEVRAITLSKLLLSPDMICYDVGAGTGSVTVEMALSAYNGHVYAIEREESAASLIAENCREFHVSNVSVVHGTAPDALGPLPAPDAAFIGGSSGNLHEIIEAILEKNPRARVIVNAVTLESVQCACESFADRKISYEIVQAGISRGKFVGSLHMLVAGNPVFIISGGGT